MELYLHSRYKPLWRVQGQIDVYNLKVSNNSEFEMMVCNGLKTCTQFNKYNDQIVWSKLKVCM